MAAPPRKKQKALSDRNDVSIKQSKTYDGLFAPFRALGFITNHVPFALQVHSVKGGLAEPRIHISTCLGRSWAMWDGANMRLLFVGTDAPEMISSLIFQDDAIWAASGLRAIKYLRGKEVASFSNPLGSSLSTLMVFGSYLMALTFDGRHLLIWDTTSENLDATIRFDNGFTATHILHPATYLNKVLVASAEGGLQLWNIKTQVCLYRFNSASLRDSSSVDVPCAITALVQSPAVDVVAIGFSSGEVAIHDVRADEKLMRVHMEGGVRSISFRADGQPSFATASSNGHIAIWDLNAGGRLLHLHRGAHDGAIASIQWLPGQPILISSGEDNSVKQWMFDTPTSAPRLLKYRSGHHQPPHLIRFYGEDGKIILTASRDRSLRNTSVVRDSRSHELSQGSLAKKATSVNQPIMNLKFSPITSLSFSRTRSKDWEDVITTHMNESYARTWRVENKTCGRWLFKPPPEEKHASAIAKSAIVSACGNFGIVAFSSGLVQMWSLESGLPRRLYQLP
ncbi:hypothetical protein FRB99_002551, partial [Tulasnella sp. 403]